MCRFHFFADADTDSHAALFADTDSYFLPMPMLIPADADSRLYV